MAYLFIHLFNNLLNQQRILQIFLDISCIMQVAVAPSFFIILLQKFSSPLQVPMSSPLLSCSVPSQISKCSWLIYVFWEFSAYINCRIIHDIWGDIIFITNIRKNSFLHLIRKLNKQKAEVNQFSNQDSRIVAPWRDRLPECGRLWPNRGSWVEL